MIRHYADVSACVFMSLCAGLDAAADSDANSASGLVDGNATG
jgi:hypothetical protein